MTYTIEEVATAAAHGKKPRRAEAFKRVCELIDTNTPLDALVDLYAYFLPPPLAKVKTPEQWVARALAGKNDERWYLRYLYSNGSRLYGGDGLRIHVADTALSTGYYDVSMTSIEDSANYPDVDSITPKHKKFRMVNLNDCVVRPWSEGSTLLAVNVAGDVWINLAYMKQAMNGSDECRVEYGERLDPVVVRNEFGYAVIAPVDMKS